MLILPGSDPLPLAGEIERIGRYGFVLRLKLDLDRPARALKAHLEGLERQPASFGRLQSPGRFLAAQLSLRLRKRPAGQAALPHNTITPDVDTASDDYATRFSGAIGRYFLAVQERMVRDFLDSSGPGRVLEVGGGHAQLVPALLEAGHEVWVQGSAPGCARRLAPLFARYPGRLRFVASSLWSLPFPDRAFDAVIAVRLLAHVEQFEPLLQEMARVSNGRVIVDFPPVFSANLVQPLLFGMKRRVEGNTRPYFSYDVRQLYPPLRAAGFGRFRVAKQFTVPMVIHRKAASPGLLGSCRDGVPLVRADPTVRKPFGAAGGKAGRHAGGGALNAMASATPAPAPETAPRLILMIAPQPFFRATGTPINVLTMCRALTESGFAVHLLTVPYGEDVDLPGLTLQRVAHVPGCGPLRVGFSAAKLAYNGLLLLAFLRLLRRRRFAAVHAIEEAALWAVPLARMRGIPAIIDLDSDLCRQLRDQGSALGRMLAGPAGWLRRFALRRAAGALTVSRTLSEIVRTENPAVPVFEINDIPIEGADRQPDAERNGSVARPTRPRGPPGGRLHRQLRPQAGAAGAGSGDGSGTRPSSRVPAAGGRRRAGTGRGLAGAHRSGRPRRCGAPARRPPARYHARVHGPGRGAGLAAPRALHHPAQDLQLYGERPSDRRDRSADPHPGAGRRCRDPGAAEPRRGWPKVSCARSTDPAAAAALGRSARHVVETRHTFAGFRRRLADCYAAVLGPTTTPTRSRTL